MSGILDGQIALVTGASRGIGRAIAERLARDKALVLVNYLQSQAAAEAVVATITQAGEKQNSVDSMPRIAVKSPQPCKLFLNGIRKSTFL